MKVLKHDGSQHHGVGIRPTIPISRTRAGIAAGRDEMLDPLSRRSNSNSRENSGAFPRLEYVRAARIAALLVILPVVSKAQTSVEYIGGTAVQLEARTQGSIALADDHYLAFYAGKIQIRVAYDRVNLIEYGQQASRRLALALVISPVFLLSKSRKHFLTIGYNGDDGRQQAIVFRVNKDRIRPMLVTLEARTGQKVQYQDEQARKARNQ